MAPKVNMMLRMYLPQAVNASRCHHFSVCECMSSSKLRFCVYFWGNSPGCLFAAGLSPFLFKQARKPLSPCIIEQNNRMPSDDQYMCKITTSRLLRLSACPLYTALSTTWTSTSFLCTTAERSFVRGPSWKAGSDPRFVISDPILP